MSFVEMALDEVKEAQVMEEGAYDLIIESADEKESKKGKPMIECVIQFSDHPNASPIWYYLSLPHEDDEPKARNFKMLNLKRFLTMFGIPFDSSGFDTNDFFGASARNAHVKVSEPDENGNTRNELNLPKLQD